MITITMEHMRDTKGTHFYQANNALGPCKSMYIKKGSFDGAPPKGIVVKVEEIK